MALNWVSMKNHSIMLVAAYRRLSEEWTRVDGKPGVEVPAAAAQVVGALAVEIAMKALICKQQGITDVTQLKNLKIKDGGHSLMALFHQLDSETKMLFKAGFDQFMAENRESIVMTFVTLDEKSIEEFIRKKTFEEELCLASKTFIEWRYSYEYDFLATHLGFMKYLISRVSLLFGIPDKMKFTKPPTLHKKMPD